MSTLVRPAALTPGTAEWREFSASYVADALRAIVRELGPLPQMLSDMEEHEVDPALRFDDTMLLWQLVDAYAEHDARKTTATEER